jgi:hypothetical protein
MKTRGSLEGRSLKNQLENCLNKCSLSDLGARGGAVVQALRYKPEVVGSIPDCVTGIFH